jgi:hypothetical protein
MTTINFKEQISKIVSGEVPVYRYLPLHNGTVREDTVYDGISQKSGQPAALVKATCTMLFDEIVEQLKHGYRVELPQMSAMLSIPGKVESASAESRRATPPVLVAHFNAKGDFKKCCQGPEFSLVNVTQGATVVVNGVIDSVSQTPDVLTNGDDVEVHVTGSGLYMPDPSDPTVGAYLADQGGQVIVKATVTETTGMTLVCVFPRIDLEPGTYRFCVASRNGLDPARYGVTIGRRNVRVVDATSGSPEEVQNG